MRQTTLALLLLALPACTLGRASSRQAGEMDAGRQDRPFVWHGTGESGPIDAVNGAIAIGSIALEVLTYDEPSGPLCGSEPGDPPHTCPAKAGDDR